MTRTPEHEPELLRAKGRAYAARCNEIATKYNDKTIYQALELAAQAYAVFGLRYVAGLKDMASFPPDRFEWSCSDGTGAIGIEVLDKQTGNKRVWPHWGLRSRGLRGH